MNASAMTPRTAWLPLTPRGVAAFARASWGRLLLVQLVVALLAAAAFVWFLRTAWTPTIREAIATLPEGAQISGGVLTWPGEPATLLAEGRFLAFTVDLEHAGQTVSTADVKVEFGKRDWQVSSLLGVLNLPSFVETTYPPGQVMAFSRAEVEPWWGAREPFLVALTVTGFVVFLFGSWLALATVYCVPVWLVAFFANRELDWAGGWRLAGAALMPGALLLALAIGLYGLRAFDLVKLSFAFGMHFVAGWIYLGVSPLFLPRNPEVPRVKGNPFVPAGTGGDKSG